MWNDMRKVQKLMDNAQLNHKQFISQVHDLAHLCHSEESVVISDSIVEAELCDAASFMKMKSLKTVSGTSMTLVFCKWVAVPERCQLFKVVGAFRLAAPPNPSAAPPNSSDSKRSGRKLSPFAWKKR